MQADLLFTFSLFYFATTTVACIWSVRISHLRGIALALVGTVGLATVSAIATKANPRADALVILGNLAGNRPGLVSALLGIALALPWILMAWVPTMASPRTTRNSILSVGLWFLLSGSLVVSAALLGVLGMRIANPGPGFVPLNFQPEFDLEEIAHFQNGNPIRIAVDEQSRVYISLMLNMDEGVAGQIMLWSPDSPPQTEAWRLVADSPVLFRPFGLAVRDNAIYVARSGISARTKGGVIEYGNHGAVTRLTDLDGDGVMDHYDDIIVDLPGSRGPDTQHQNNGIALAPDNTLYLTSGNNTNRSVPEHPWEGKLLCWTPKKRELKVFAAGFRNPWGVAVSDRGEVFCTDNDANANPGDEINHVLPENHYGHPFVLGQEDGGGDFTAPLALSDPNTSFAGLAYGNSPALPEKYRDALFVADFKAGLVMWAKIRRKGNRISLDKLEKLAGVPLPVDVACAADGSIYIVSRSNRVFRLSPKRHDSSKADRSS